MIFAKIMKDKKDKQGYLQKLIEKYRFVIMSDSSFEEKISFRLSRLNVIVVFFSLLIILFLITLVLIAFSPLQSLVPGKSKKEVQQKLIELSLVSDSLEKTLKNNSVYLENINNIIQGKDGFLKEGVSKKIKKENSDSFFEKSTADSLLRVSVEKKEKGSIFINETKKNDLIMFFPPIKGLVIDGFNLEKNHFGVDLLAKEKTKISAVLEGTVIISHWSSETGFVIGVQHKNDYISFYKHNSVLLNKVGDYVVAGEHIAIIGNSGELSSGPHLHFELWHKGTPIDPEHYISF